jgi:hypothetical protein
LSCAIAFLRIFFDIPKALEQPFSMTDLTTAVPYQILELLPIDVSAINVESKPSQKRAELFISCA